MCFFLITIAIHANYAEKKCRQAKKHKHLNHLLFICTYMFKQEQGNIAHHFVTCYCHLIYQEYFPYQQINFCDILMTA